MRICFLHTWGFALFLLGFGAGGPGFAGYHGFSADDVVEFRLLPGWRTESGTRMTALHVVLAPGWKTYWRAPGDTGIPPRFDWARSKNLQKIRIHWPAPRIFDQNGLRTIGYRQELVLPIELTPNRLGAPITMDASVEIGVCKDVCIPVSARIRTEITGSGSSDQRIKASIQARPMPASRAGMRQIKCEIEPISDGLRLTASIQMPPQGNREFAIFELPDKRIWIAEAKTKRQGSVLIAQTDFVPPNSRPFSLDRSDVRITVISDNQAVDIRGCKG